MPGHVYVIRADLTRLACDAVMPSCDSDLNITRAWAGLFPERLPQGDAGWLRLPAEHRDGNIVRLPRPRNGPWVVPVIAISAGGADTPASVAAAMAEGVRRLTPDLEPGGGRVLPLVGVTLAGASAGGLGGRRGELIEELLSALTAVSREAHVDIALTLRDPRDMAAAQARRTDDQWAELPPHLVRLADDLGTRAAAGELSLFLGAGVSVPVGLPNWQGLVDALALEAGVDFSQSTDNLIDRASALKIVLGERRYGQILARLLTTDRHALAHAILAGLGVKQTVTTNFDRCFENALGAIYPDSYRVLTRALAVGGQPWVLKLHGDIAHPSSLVFTREDYDRHPQEYQAIRGVVQGLMLTSHLLFVGFGLADDNFLDLARAVSKVRREAETRDGERAGTALALTSVDVRHELRHDLEFHAMQEGGDTATAARILEIFLDRLAWRAATSHHLRASYVLDQRYESALAAADRQLRSAVDDFAATLRRGKATESEAWPRVRRMLVELGRDDDLVAEGPTEEVAPRDAESPIRRGQAFEFHELLHILSKWLDDTDEATISGGSSADRGFVSVTIDGIPCALAADTTRNGVRRFLELMARGVPLVVINDSAGRPVKVAAGDPPERIPGFYLYTDEPYWEPRILHARLGVQHTILRAVSHLHHLGYQQVRVRPGMSGSGMYWRVKIAAAADLKAPLGQAAVAAKGGAISYTTGAADRLLDTRIIATTPASEVADTILRGLSHIRGREPDWEYAGWYAGLLGLAEQHGALPIAYADYFDDDEGWEVGWGSGIRYPHPPAWRR
ncbi:hypothetical protein HNR19_003135 [Nocardioides thalensis]|uniref:SIR2-like domain-containing protein n=1 Tax=Nocardioides thalensis TaxID=1914755 RepID=A0A853C597_9ACTN|nr:SIR2 family protein [Nocardioides thalensis]NYJ02437.1 hypothetical protein [Nocardioides thalensis]